MKSFTALFLALLFVSFPSLGMAQQDKLDASALLSNGQLVAATIVSRAGEDEALREVSAAAKPFWRGMQDAISGLEKAAISLTAKNDSFFIAIANIASGYAQADVGRIMAGSTDELLAEEMRNLGLIVTALYENYSKEAARLKQGGELTQQEKQALKTLKSQQEELLKKLDKLEMKVGQDNQKITEGITALRESSQKITNSNSTVPGFVGGFYAAHFMYNWMWGWHWWWGPWGAWAPGYININVNIWDDWIDSYPYDWALAEAYVDVTEIELLGAELDGLEVGQALADIEAVDYSLEAVELLDLTTELDQGWDDVSSDLGFEVLEDMSTNFDTGGFYGGEAQWDSFDSMGIDDFGADFGGDFDFGFDF